MHAGDVAPFDRFARLYDFFMPGADRAKLDAGLTRAERPLERVVDVGGGPGRAVRELDAAWRLVVDPAQGMLRQARRHDLQPVQGDGARLPLSTGSVDAVLVTDALHHMGDQHGVLEEAARVLRPGGVLVVREFDPTTLRGRGLVLAERAVGFDSAFYSPDALADDIARTGLRASVVERGFGYTVVGVKRVESEQSKSRESEVAV
ncbi:MULTISPECIES: class I SAM-dependent methyltransferase [Salinibaculum]|uniref:class I SAM-dependent methyltransferase n=1 Tax=Salinibaculum TaxID=2732368 RepID=UPI0030CC81D7